MFDPTSQGPPFRFHGVTSRVFPLRADGHALQRMCDTYLNRFPEQIYFRPAAPYVLLSLLHYGRMSYATRTAAHHGWVSQNEVYFGVPLDWGRLDHGRWTRHGTAVVTPFIFVDQPWSIEIGREVYGWPKEPAEFRREVNRWVGSSPADREPVLSLHAETFVTPYASERPGSVPLVEIDRAAPLGVVPSLWQPPLTLDNPWWGALTWWREAMRTSTTAIRDAATYAPQLLAASRLAFGGPGPVFYTANLKQVRSLEDPTVASYQAITMAPIRLTAVHRTGLLGEPRVLLGDPTGGYRIRIQRHPLFPIIETLGLAVSGEDHHREPRDLAIRGYTAGVPGNTRLEPFPAGLTSDDGDVERGVATLAPVVPFWLEADLEYGRGDTVSWSSEHLRDGAWHGRIAGDATSEAPAGAPSWVTSASPRTSPRGRTALFEPTWGARALPAPPYFYPQLTMRILALPATPALAGVVAALAPPPEVGQFRLLGDRPHVLMLVTTSEQMAAQVNSAGSWWKRHVAFFVPVIWTRDGVDRVAAISMVRFTDSRLAATIAREIGPDVIAADLHAPPDAWLDHAGPIADRRLLWLATSTLPAQGVDAEAQQRVLLEVLAREPGGGAPGASPNFAGGDARLCVLGRRRFRDASDPESIAYDEWFSQNLIVRTGASAGWQFSPAALEVRIHHYPDRLDLVGRLALDAEHREYGKSERPGRGWEGAIVHVVPAGFAWATLDVTQACNTSLAVRSHGGPWTQPARPAGAAPCAPQANDAARHLLEALANHLLVPSHG